MQTRYPGGENGVTDPHDVLMNDEFISRMKRSKDRERENLAMMNIDPAHYTMTKPEDNKDYYQRETEEDDDDTRETWGKKVDFLLSVIGFAVDLANVWRFPYLCYKNGGGAFLIPYGVMLILGGIPLFYMELALGQYMRKGAITCWGRICPLFKGIGYSVVLIAFYVDFFYNVIIAWALYFFVNSFTHHLPWTKCNNTWNTENCYDKHLYDEFNITNKLSTYKTLKNTVSTTAGGLLNLTLSSTPSPKRISPAQEFFDREMLEIHRSKGVEELGMIKWQLVLCLLAVYLICYFSLWKGISTSGKVVWFTALFPYVVLVILLFRGITLKGAADGIRYYLTPDFSRLSTAEVWVDAATQVFFSLGPGFGVLLAFASYNKFHNNVYMDAMATSCINCGTSFLSGFVIFSVLGYMADRSGKDISEVAAQGPGLVFVVYPEAISTLPWPTFWALIFFMMLLTLGLDSSFGGSEAIITALSDEFPWIKRRRELFVAMLFTLYFMIGLASCSYGGAYVVNIMDRYAAGYSILFAVFFESLAISWFYGLDRFCGNIKDMLGFEPGPYWRFCWKFFAPIFILFIMLFGLAMYEPLTYGEYVYPWWANLIGWCMALSSMLCIPGMACVALIRAKGSLKERWISVTTPVDVHRETRNAYADQSLLPGHTTSPIDAV